MDMKKAYKTPLMQTKFLRPNGLLVSLVTMSQTEGNSGDIVDAPFRGRDWEKYSDEEELW